MLSVLRKSCNLEGRTRKRSCHIFG
jgi:hypothetical protein